MRQGTYRDSDGSIGSYALKMMPTGTYRDSDGSDSHIIIP